MTTLNLVDFSNLKIGQYIIRDQPLWHVCSCTKFRIIRLLEKDNSISVLCTMHETKITIYKEIFFRYTLCIPLII